MIGTTYRVCPRALFSVYIAEVCNGYAAFREMGNNLQLAPHAFNKASQIANIHVRPTFQLLYRTHL